MPVTSGALWRLALGSALCWIASCGTPPPANVLLVSIDSLRADHVHAYGYARETTPTIDRLAAEGARFEHAIAASSWTLPTHVTLLTGLPPEAHGVVSSTRALLPAAVTLAEVLQARGYRTAGFVSGPYLRRIYGFAQGFDVYDESVVADGHFASHHGATSPGLTTLVTDFLEEWDESGRARPFFVFLHMWDVHFDYDPPPPWDAMFDPDYAGSITGKGFVRNKAIRPDMPRRDLEHLIALYDGEIRYTDEHLGRIVDRLISLGVLDDTVVVVTADHGEEFFEHGRRGHEPRLYDELVRVPLVLRFTRTVAAGQVIVPQVRQMDVAPTILGLLDVAPPPGFPGTGADAIDVSPWITGAVAPAGIPRLRAYCSTAAYDGSGKNAQSAVRTLTAKYVEGISPPARSQYYELDRDPGEHVDLLEPGAPAPGDPATLAALRADVRRWNDQHPPDDRPSEEIRIDEAQRLRLLQLGYIE